MYLELATFIKHEENYAQQIPPASIVEEHALRINFLSSPEGSNHAVRQVFFKRALSRFVFSFRDVFRTNA